MNQDGTINSASNPAELGSIVSIFATGLGPVTPVPRDGAVAIPPLGTNVLPAVIGIPSIGVKSSGETVLEPQYAGPAPFQVYGVSQVNLTASFDGMYIRVGAAQSNGRAAPRVVIAEPVPFVLPGSSQMFLIHVGE